MRAAQKFRAHDVKSLAQRFLARSDEAELVSVVRESREQLERAMDADRQAFRQDSARESWK